MVIRLAVLEDAAAIAGIHIQSWQAAYNGLLPQDYLYSLDRSRRTAGWRAMIENQTPPSPAAAVIINAGTPQGFAHVCPTRDADHRPSVGELSSIYLRPDAWGRGLGRDLMAYALGLLREASNTEATLWVLQGNNRATRFYEAAGWSPDGLEKQATVAGAVVTETRYRIAL